MKKESMKHVNILEIHKLAKNEGEKVIMLVEKTHKSNRRHKSSCFYM